MTRRRGGFNFSLVYVLVLAALSSACGRGRSEASAAELTVADDSLMVTLETPAAVSVGSAVPFRLTLTNTTDRQVTLYMLGRELTWDVIVTTGEGTTVWRRLDDSPFQEILAIRPLGPREKMVLESKWPSARPVGSYVATARVLTDGVPLQSLPVRFEIR